MSISLSLIGQLNMAERLSRVEARDWLARAAVWFEGLGDAVLDARVGLDVKNNPVLLIVLHPASPTVEVRLGASGKLRVSAITTPAGPGYHIHLCNLFRQMAAEFNFTWVADDCTDLTGYLHVKNRESCEQHFLRWLADECANGEVNIGIPPGHGFTYPAEVFTPLGPRTRQWRAEVAANPAKGRDFFAWWSPDLNTAFYRDRALVRLWCDFFWRPPLTEEEGELADQIANDLASAFKLEPDAELPWPEWLELLAAIEGDEGFCVTPNDRVLSIELWKRAGPLPEGPGEHTGGSLDKAASGRIGYRRRPIRVTMEGGWSIEVPGEFARERGDDHTWTAWDQTRTVWFQALRFTKRDGSPPTAAETAEFGRKSLPDGEVLPSMVRDDLRGEAVFGTVEEDGRTLWRLTGVTGAAGQLTVCNVYSENESDRDWAVRTWHSLRHSS